MWPHPCNGSCWGHFTHSYLLLLKLLIIPSFSLVFKISSVLMVCLLIGSHRISPLALGQLSARNLGFNFDSHISFSDQINSIQILSFSHLRHSSNSSSFFLSHSSWKFQKTWLLQFGISQADLNKLQRIQHSLASVINKQNFITSHGHSNNYTGFQSKNRSQTLSSHIQKTYKSPIFTIVSFPSFCFYTIFWFTCSFYSICPIITWQKGFLCHRSTTLEFTPSWLPKLVFFTNIPFLAQNTSSKLRSPRLFPISLLSSVYPDYDSCYSHFMPYRMTPSVRHTAIGSSLLLLLSLLLLHCIELASTPVPYPTPHKVTFLNQLLSVSGDLIHISWLLFSQQFPRSLCLQSVLPPLQLPLQIILRISQQHQVICIQQLPRQSSVIKPSGQRFHNYDKEQRTDRACIKVLSFWCVYIFGLVNDSKNLFRFQNR